MYCSKCGNEINNNDLFCAKCGKSINHLNESDNSNDDILSMGWYNFYVYLRFPICMISILSQVLQLTDFYSNNILALLYSLFIFIIYGTTFAFMIFKKKLGYYINIALIVLETVSIFILSLSSYNYSDIAVGFGYILGTLAICIIWSVLNIKYFIKRKQLFK